MMGSLREIYSSINKRIHILIWKLFGKNDDYIKLQKATSYHTRENEEVQKGILFALETYYKYVEDKGSVILDAGCGDGWTMDQLKSAGYSNLFGIDINDEKLEDAKTIGGHDVRKALLPDLDFEDDYFDGIFCRHVYEHLLYPEKTVQSFNRVLKNGGILLIIAPESDLGAEQNESHVVKITCVEDISDLIASHGFKILDTSIHDLEDKEFWVIA